MADEIKQWEYRVQTFGRFWTGVKTEEIQEILNQWGEEGWEVISATAFENYNQVHVIAKRSLSRNTRRSRNMPE
jgi:hypothetical protein